MSLRGPPRNNGLDSADQAPRAPIGVVVCPRGGGPRRRDERRRAWLARRSYAKLRAPSTAQRLDRTRTAAHSKTAPRTRERAPQHASAHAAARRDDEPLARRQLPRFAPQKEPSHQLRARAPPLRRTKVFPPPRTPVDLRRDRVTASPNSSWCIVNLVKSIADSRQPPSNAPRRRIDAGAVGRASLGARGGCRGAMRLLDARARSSAEWPSVVRERRRRSDSRKSSNPHSLIDSSCARLLRASRRIAARAGPR